MGGVDPLNVFPFPKSQSQLSAFVLDSWKLADTLPHPLRLSARIDITGDGTIVTLAKAVSAHAALDSMPTAPAIVYVPGAEYE